MEGLELVELTPPSCYNLVNCTTGQIDYVINGTSNGVDLSANVNNYVGQIVIGATTIYGCWNIQVSFDCTGFRTDLGLEQIVASEDDVNYCGCPTGYTYNPTTGLCELSTPAIAPVISRIATTTPPPSIPSYSANGAVIYNDITNATFPIIATPQPSGNSIILSTNTPIYPATTPHPIVTTPYPTPWPPASPVITNPSEFNKAFRDNIGTGPAITPAYSILNSAWYTNATDNWLYNYGINTNEVLPNPLFPPTLPPGFDNVPLLTWIGFNKCLIITKVTQYCIALAADNSIRLFINNELKIELNVGNTPADLFPFKYVHIFPITLQPGTYQIKVEGLNFTTSGAFAMSMYETTPAALASYTTTAQLDSVTAYSTLEERGNEFQTSSNPDYGYTCSQGYNLVTCDGVECLSTVPYRPCCYQLINCQTDLPEYQFTYNGVQQAGVPNPDTIGPTQVINFLNVFETTTITGCYRIIKTQCDNSFPTPTYSWSLIDTLTLLSDCQTCLGVCVRLTDCAQVQDSIIVDFPDLTAYIDKTIKFEITTPVPDGWPVGTYCASVVSEDECEDAIALNINGTITEFDTCPDCNPQCYLLTDCSDPTNTMVVSGDLSQYEGYVITLAGCDYICWIVSLANDCTGSVPSPPIVNSYLTNNKCCYVFNKISGLSGDITIDGIDYPLSAGIDINLLATQINSLNKGICVVVNSDITKPGAEICITGPHIYGDLTYNTSVDTATKNCEVISACEQCLPQPVPPTPFTLHTRKVKPGYDTKGCPPEYTEKVLCNYAEQAFDEMAKARYGIKICCEKDFDYWDIKKQILELKALYDENVCEVQFPCKCYSLSNSNPSVPTVFNYSDCNAKYLTISVTNGDGIVKVCATNVPVGMGGTPTVVLNGLCQDEICP